MRVKWNRQLDGSLARRQAEEEKAAAAEENNHQEGKEYKHKESPKLFRLFRKKKRRGPVPPGALPGAPYTPSEEADEDDCASISSVATIASQPTAEVCQRDRTMSIFSSFRLSFPGSKKKSKRRMASTSDTNDPMLHQEKEPGRYSSPDLRRERLDGPCGGQLSSSSPSVKDGATSRKLRKENEELIKHSITNCFQEAVLEELGGKTTLSKSSPSIENSTIGIMQSENTFKLAQKPSLKQDTKTARDQLGDHQMEMSKSTPSVKVTFPGFEIIDKSSNSTHFKQYNTKCIQKEIRNGNQADTGLIEVSRSTPSVRESITKNNDAFNQISIIDTNLYDDRNKLSTSISFVEGTANCDLKTLERLRTENSNSLDQLKRDDANRCAQKNMRSAKSVSFFESSLSPNDVTCVAEAGAFPTVNAASIEEAIERKSPAAHSAEPFCWSKSTPDDSAEPFHAVSDAKTIEKAAQFVAPAFDDSICDKRNALYDVNMKNSEFRNGEMSSVCSEVLELHSTSKYNRDNLCCKECDKRSKISGLSAKILKSEFANGDIDFKSSSQNLEYSNVKSVGADNGPVCFSSVISEDMCNEANIMLKPTIEAMQSKESTNSVISSCVMNEFDSVQDKNIEEITFEHKNEFNLEDISQQIVSNALNVDSASVSNEGNEKKYESCLTEVLSKPIETNTTEKDHFDFADLNRTLNVACSDLPTDNISELNTFKLNSSHLEIRNTNCTSNFLPNTQVFPECHNHANLHNLNSDSNFSTRNYAQEHMNDFSFKRLFQCLTNSDVDFNISDYFVQLSLFYAENLKSEFVKDPTEIRKKSVLHCKQSDTQLDFLRNNALSYVESYLHKLIETGEYFDSCKQTKSVIVWNASLVQNIISNNFHNKVCYLPDPMFDCIGDPPFVAATREKNQIIPERCPDVLSSAPTPDIVTVPEHNLHIDAPQYAFEKDNTEMISNVGKTSFGLFCDVPNGNVCLDRDIYNERVISVGKCEDVLEKDSGSIFQSTEGCSLLEECTAIELEVGSLERCVSEQKRLNVGLQHVDDTLMQLQEENFHSTILVSESGQVPSSTNKLIDKDMRPEFIDSLPEENKSSNYIDLKNNGFSSESESDKNVIWSKTTPKILKEETVNSIGVTDDDVAYEGVKNKIKMFENVSDISPDSCHSKTDFPSSGKLELSRKKNCEKSKISMIPSLRKGIPIATKNTHSKSSKVKSQIQKKEPTIKEYPEISSRKSSNEFQVRPLKPQSKKKFSNESQNKIRPQSDKNSCSSSLHNERLNSKSNCHQSNILVTENIPKSDPDHSPSCIIPEERSTIPEISERSKSEELLLDSIPQFPVSNPNTSVRRHSAAAVVEQTPDFFRIAIMKNGANFETSAYSESSPFEPTDLKSSNLTLEEVSVREDLSSANGLQARCASLPLVMGQVHVSSSRNNSIIKDAQRGCSRIPKKHAGRGSTHLSTNKLPVRPPVCLSKAELTQEIQRLGTLCEARTKELNRLKMETKHVTVGFDAFAALFKYMVEDVNGLSVPKLSEDLEKTLKQLELAKQDLAYYEREVEEMKAHHCQELNDLSNKLFEVFQGEVTELGTKHQEEVSRLKHEHEKQLQATSETYKVGYEETQACHEAAVIKLQQELITQREELEMFHEKELQELEQKYCESSETLQEHIEQLQKKCAELKQHSLGMEDAMRKDTDSKLQWVTSRKGDLEKEVESLKAVLEMKNKELHTIRVQNLEMEKQLEELPLAREKIKMLSARAEDLEALMVEKTRVERKLSTENQTIRDTYEKESKYNKRLSMENEELQWRLRQAEQSIISGSFSEVTESAEELENCPLSPVKSPHQMSRSVFFTFVDKDVSSPRSQYKKITPGFSSGYKTSPSKSSAVPSPRKGRGQSESTPKKTASTLKQQRRQRASTAVDNGGAQSFASSMVSSVGSECSVFDQREELLEEHKEQIMESLEILREQRCSEENDDEPMSQDVPEQNGEDLVLEKDRNGDVASLKDGELQLQGLVKDPVDLKQNGNVPCQKARELQHQGFVKDEVDLKQNGALVVMEETNGDLKSLKSSESKTTWHDVPQQNGDVLALVPESLIGLERPVVSNGEKVEPLQESGSDPVTPSDKWQEEVTNHVTFQRDDEMSRSAEFSDPKTYYHMTFPVLKEAGAQDCDTEDRTKENFAPAQVSHSIVESSEVVSHKMQVSKEISLEVTSIPTQGNGASTVVVKVAQQNALSQSFCVTDSEQDSKCKEQSREKNRWRTM